MKNKQLEAMPVGTKFRTRQVFPSEYPEDGYYTKREDRVEYFEPRLPDKVFRHEFSEFSEVEQFTELED